MDTSIPTPSELLHSYLDGELEPALESSLFSSLNDSADLRTEMRDMLALSRAVREDKIAMVPPIASTAAVFGALGMSTSMLVQSGWLSTLWSKIWIPVAAGVLSSVVTWYAVSPSTSTQNATTGVRSEQSGQQSQAAAGSSSTVDQSSGSTGTAAVGAAALGAEHVASSLSMIHDTLYRTKIVYRDRVVSASEALGSNANAKTQIQKVYVVASPSDLAEVPAMNKNTAQNNAEGSANNNQSATTNSPGSTRADNISTEPSLAQTFAALTVRRSNPQNLLITPDVVNTEAAEPELYRQAMFKPSAMVYVRALGGRSLVSVNAPSDNGGGLNNAALGIRYAFNPLFSAGVELGSESIAMKFSGIVEGSVTHYEANPALTWASVYGHISLFPSWWNTNWQPFVQANIGGTNYGVLLKTIIGTTVSPTARLRMIFGAEASGLLYTVQGTSYQTFKIGYTYGIGYQF